VTAIAERAAVRRRRSVRAALYDLADAIAAIAEAHPQVVPYIAREMTHPDPARRRLTVERMQYPALYEALLDDLARTGRLRWPRRRASLARQLVDLTTGALVRVGDDFPTAALRAELRANVDLFLAGAVDGAKRPSRPPPSGSPAPQGRPRPARTPRSRPG
jgi:hypothetical protein